MVVFAALLFVAGIFQITLAGRLNAALARVRYGVYSLIAGTAVLLAWAALTAHGAG